MNQSTRNVTVVVAVLVLLGAGVWWSETSKAVPAGQLRVAGDVRADIRTVSAPAIAYPTPDYTVGIPKLAGSAGGSSNSSAAARRGSSAARSGQPVVAGMLERVLVREGDRVSAGQVMAEFDTTMLDLGVKQAEATARKARKDVSVLGNNLDKLNTAAGKLTTAREKIATAKNTLAKAKSALLKARKQLLAQQAQLLQAKAHRAQLEQQLSALKASLPSIPLGAKRDAVLKQIQDLTILLASIDPGLAGIAKGLATIDANLAKVATGMAALPKASAQINTAASQLSDAKTQLKNAKSVLGIVADAQDVAVNLAKARRSQAFVRSPVAGVVTFARRSGTVAMVGAPLVRVAADGPQLVDTYLTAEQAATVDTGSNAEVSFDSGRGAVLHGRVSLVGSAYVFPPTSFPTQIVHMTRALKVTVELDPGADVPEGTPVDVTLHTNTNR